MVNKLFNVREVAAGRGGQNPQAAAAGSLCPLRLSRCLGEQHRVTLGNLLNTHRSPPEGLETCPAPVAIEEEPYLGFLSITKVFLLTTEPFPAGGEGGTHLDEELVRGAAVPVDGSEHLGSPPVPFPRLDELRARKGIFAGNLLGSPSSTPEAAGYL